MKHKTRKIVGSFMAAALLFQATAATAFCAAQGGEETRGYKNYIYHAAAADEEPAAADDALFSQQWALDNDGSFSLVENANPYPVFDNPFEDPAGRGRWRPEQAVSGAESVYARRNAVSSVSGVDINAADAWKHFNTNGKETVIAIIDTGVNYANSQLFDGIWVNDDEIAGDGIDNDGNGYVDDVYGWNFYDGNNQVYTGEDDNHGTHGAGTIIAARDTEGTAGIAGSSNVKVMVLKALGGEDGEGTTESIVEAIRYAEANGAVVCNMSLGTTGNDETLRRTMEQSGMLFVVAAGNGTDWTGTGKNIDRTPTYPAAWNLDNIISVANIGPSGTLHSSSNYGAASVDLAAPGSYILSTVGDGDYSYMTGTSMAAPMVSAAAGMLFSQHDGITARQVKTILLGTVKKMDSLSGKTATGGMLDAGAALSFDLAEIDTLPAPAESQTQAPGGSQGAGGDQTAARSYAPVISIRQTQNSSGNFLTLTVTDRDNDLKAVRYAQGARSAVWFAGGTNGNAVTLANGSKSFTYNQSGTWTFYAVDQKGNETVSTVYLTVDLFEENLRQLMRWWTY